MMPYNTSAKRRAYEVAHRKEHATWMRKDRKRHPEKYRERDAKRNKTLARQAYRFAYNRTPEFREMTKKRDAAPEHKAYKKKLDAKPQHKMRRRIYAKKTGPSRRMRRNIKLAGRVPPKRCELCQKVRKLHFDHDHKTGEFRGWICHACNVGLGHLGDTVKGLQTGIAYLKGELPWQNRF